MSPQLGKQRKYNWCLPCLLLDEGVIFSSNTRSVPKALASIFMLKVLNLDTNYFISMFIIPQLCALHCTARVFVMQPDHFKKSQFNYIHYSTRKSTVCIIVPMFCNNYRYIRSYFIKQKLLDVSF